MTLDYSREQHAICSWEPRTCLLGLSEQFTRDRAGNLKLKYTSSTPSKVPKFHHYIFDAMGLWSIVEWTCPHCAHNNQHMHTYIPFCFRVSPSESGRTE